MIKANVLTRMSLWMVGGAQSARIKDAIAAMENMDAVEAHYREHIATKLNETRTSMTEAGADGKAAVVHELEAAIATLETTQAKLDRARESRQRRLREARAALRALGA